MAIIKHRRMLDQRDIAPFRAAPPGFSRFTAIMQLVNLTRLLCY